MSKIIGLQGSGVRSNIVGAMPSETASIAYTGELLPAGTASYSGISIDPTKRYLKNSGKDKTPALVESGQGKFFNGTSQYLNTGIIPNQAQGTLVTRFTMPATTGSIFLLGSQNSSGTDRIGACFPNLTSLLISYGSLIACITYSFTFVVGRSYHMAIKYSGNNVYLYIDSVLVGSGSSTLVAPTLPLFIGARNLNGAAASYWNNVIDETYYYDVALPDTAIQSLYLYPEKVKAYNGAIVPDIGYEDNCKLFLPLCENSGSNVYNVAVNPATALAITNYATAMHTSAAKLSYGAQCISWKRDSLGVLRGMSGGLSFDGGVSINRVNTAWIPLSTESFVVEAVIYSKSGLAVNQNMGAKNFRWNINTTGNSFGLYASSWRTTLAVVANQWHHVVIEVNGTTVKRYVDGVLLETLTGVTWTSDITAYFIGDDGFSGVAFRTIIGTPKIHKGTQYAKFNIDKAWANAQKIITKLGA